MPQTKLSCLNILVIYELDDVEITTDQIEHNIHQNISDWDDTYKDDILSEDNENKYFLEWNVYYFFFYY